MGDIQREEQTKDAGLFQTPLPRANSTDAILLDLFGAFRTISLTGRIIGTESEQQTFISNIEAIADGKQDGSTFVSSFIASPANRTVFVQTFRWEKNAADESKLDYTLTLFEGGI